MFYCEHPDLFWQTQHSTAQHATPHNSNMLTKDLHFSQWLLLCSALIHFSDTKTFHPHPDPCIHLYLYALAKDCVVAGVGPRDPRAGGVHQVRVRGAEVVRGRGGAAAAAHHAERAAGPEAERVPGGGHHAVVLSLHHRTQPGHRGTWLIQQLVSSKFSLL